MSLSTTQDKCFRNIQVGIIKRISFQHEKEVRALLLDSLHNPDAPEGVYCEVDLGALVHEIITAPFAHDWFVDLVRSLAKRYGIGDRTRTVLPVRCPLVHGSPSGPPRD